MNDSYRADEKLYRAVYPPELAPMYWKRDGSLSYMAFIDPRGLSVDRGYYRDDAQVKREMSKRLTGSIVKFYVRACNEAGALVRYLPSKTNIFHSEIHGSSSVIPLSKHQSYCISKRAVKI